MGFDNELFNNYLFSEFAFKDNVDWLFSKKCKVGDDYVNIDYYNLPASFDIETSSWRDKKGRKRANMYCWQMSFNDTYYLGRTWDDFYSILYKIKTYLGLSYEKRRLVIWVHNLSYEFQFLKNRLNFVECFAIDNRTPIQAITRDGIEFRDSYILTGKSLEKVGEEVGIQKLKEDAEESKMYKKVHTSETPLTMLEIEYCFRDVQILNKYIENRIEQGENITDILLTKTMYIRRYCRNMCFYGDEPHKRTSKTYKKYKALMDSLTLEPDEYNLLTKAFQGGFTHANARKSFKTWKNVTSLDFASSYPAVLLTEKFPMSKGEKIKIDKSLSYEEYKKITRGKGAILTVWMKDIILKDDANETPISASRCSYLKDAELDKIDADDLDNGRVWKAGKICTTCTNIDLDIYMHFYQGEDGTELKNNILITELWVYEMAYLPINLIKSILEIYKKKESLKGLKEKALEYKLAKEDLNSIFGMMVSAIVHDEIDWKTWTVERKEKFKEEKNIELIDKYNKDKNRFLFYPWGVFCTAYARKNLFAGILQCGEDYLYSDTDSVKILNYEKHKEWFNKYNQAIKKKLFNMLNFYKLDIDEYVQNQDKTIGMWDNEGTSLYFKTLGAKKYLYYKDGELHATVAGVNKQGIVNYLNDTTDIEIKIKNDKTDTTDIKDIFDKFDNNLVVSEDYTGKLTSTYIDEEYFDIIEDYQGNSAEVHELSYINLEPVSFKMHLDDYIESIIKINTKRK